MIPSFKVWAGQMFAPRAKMSSALVLKLAPIDADVKLFGEAFSAMAKRNVAASLVQNILAFEADWKKAFFAFPMPTPLVTLLAEARKEAGISASGPKYTQIACIAHNIVTGKFDPNLFVAEWDNANMKYNFDQNIVEYEGEKSDKADANAKISRMKRAIHQAQITCPSSADTSTLKLFMAPEFYFRGIRGAYNIQMVSIIFENLRRFTSQERFKDWLFVFGTVIAATYDDRLYCSHCLAEGANALRRVGRNKFVCNKVGCPPNSVKEWRYGAQIDNVALVQKGGEADDKNSYVITKEYVSHIDFRRSPTQLELDAGLAATGYTQTTFLDPWSTNRRIEIDGRHVRAMPPPGSVDVGGSASKFADERMGGAIFTIDGIRFGLEICLDHLVARIPPGTGMQVQLVPSAGASLQTLATINGGIGFNVDGLSAAGDVQISGSVNKPTGTAGPGITVFDAVPLPYP